MGRDTQHQTLGDYFSLQRGTTYKSSLLGHPGPVLLGLASIARNGGFRTDSLKTYGGDSSEKLLVQPGGLYVSLKDVTQSADLLGAIARLPRDHPPGRLTQDTVKLEPIGDDVPLDYLYWLLRTPQYRSYCRAHATGTTNLALARDDFLAFPAPGPDDAQLKLVAMLEAIESRIELNHRMNATLEEIARALFKSWFVDFDPVRAQAEGRKTGLPAVIEALFSDEIVATNIQECPKGWTWRTIGEVMEIVGGTTPRTKEIKFWEGGIHNWASPKDLSGLGSPVLRDTAKKVTPEGLAQIGSGLLPAGTVLLSSRAPIGYRAITVVPTAINQGFIALKPGNVPSEYLLRWLEVSHDEIVSRANGSTFLEISKRNFREIPFLLPPSRVLQAFKTIAAPLFNKMALNEAHTETLRQLRDALLPELMSGNIRLEV